MIHGCNVNRKLFHLGNISRIASMCKVLDVNVNILYLSINIYKAKINNSNIIF